LWGGGRAGEAIFTGIISETEEILAGSPAANILGGAQRFGNTQFIDAALERIADSKRVVETSRILAKDGRRMVIGTAVGVGGFLAGYAGEAALICSQYPPYYR
jgi:hypothetical protein